MKLQNLIKNLIYTFKIMCNSVDFKFLIEIKNSYLIVVVKIFMPSIFIIYILWKINV